MRDDDIDDTIVRRPRSSDGSRESGGTDPLGDTVIRPIPPVPTSRPESPATADVRDDPSDATVVRARTHVPVPEDDPLGDTVILPAVRALRSGPPAGDPEDTVVRHRSDTSGVTTPTEVRRADGGDHRAAPGPAAPPTRRVPSVRVAGRVVRLDQPVVIGRRPGLPRVLRGPEPVLVTVPSPSGQVSSSHVLVHAEGEAAVVEDLRSTNGTVVRPPGAAPFRMRSGASNVVLTGTVVEIGDGNVIEVLSPHLRAAPTADDLDPFTAPPPGPPTTGTRHPRERP